MNKIGFELRGKGSVKKLLIESNHQENHYHKNVYLNKVHSPSREAGRKGNPIRVKCKYSRGSAFRSPRF
jgi:hypothetical protein